MPDNPDINYPKLDDLRGPGFPVSAKAINYLLDCWYGDYCRHWRNASLVQTADRTSFYLFDVEAERLVAAWSLSQGKAGTQRDNSRQSGHPKKLDPANPNKNDRGYHRGHAIPHQGGGGLDINLVDQLAKVNNGAFRRLENMFVGNPESLYFTYWKYNGRLTQVPSAVEQGLLIPGQRGLVARHGN